MRLRSGPSEIGPFRRVLRVFQSGVVLGAGLVEPPETAEEVGPHGVQEVVPLERQVLGREQSRLRPLDLGQRDGAVEGDDRGRRERAELVVERQDGAPVGAGEAGRDGMDGVDGGLDLVGTGT